MARFKFFDVLFAVLAAQFLHVGILRQRRVVVFAQAPRVEVDHLLKIRQSVLHLKDLVDLFLIAHNRKTRTTMAHDISHLFGVCVLIKRHRHRADHLR